MFGVFGPFQLLMVVQSPPADADAHVYEAARADEPLIATTTAAAATQARSGIEREGRSMAMFPWNEQTSDRVDGRRRSPPPPVEVTVMHYVSPPPRLASYGRA